MLLGLETFSYHLAFAYGKMNIFDFIQRATELGLDGVQINVEGPDLAHIGSDDPGFLREIRETIDGLGLFVELDTCGTDPSNLTRILNICRSLGSDRMRVYASVGGCLKKELRQAVKDIRQVLNICVEYGVKIAFENHEFESSHDVLEVVRKVNSEHVGTHIDTGNSMMVWEDPIDAIAAMAPYASSTHFKDHLVIMPNNQSMIVGVPLGKGSIDLIEAYRILAEQSPLARINIEVCYGYSAPFRLPEAEGCGAKLGQGCFRIQPPPYDPAVIAPHILRNLDKAGEWKSYTWQDLAKIPSSESERRELMELQDQAVVESIEYVKKLNDLTPKGDAQCNSIL